MRITFVNVGYGDAILMESDTGYTALLDGGGNLPQEKYDPKTDHKIYDPKALTKDKITKEEYRRCRKPIGIGSLVGVIIGATPGTGGGLAAFIAYNQVKQASKHPETFGKGEIEGLAVAESANNGACGATMIPMQGNVLYAIMLGLLVVNVFMYIVGTGLTRFYAHITRIPYEILAPIVLTFCIAGSYSTNNRIYDIYIILIFGIVSYFLRRMGFQLVPILLGIVLGPLAEKNFRRAMVISEGSFSIFFTRPISCAFILIAIVSVAIFGIRNYKSRKLAKQNTAETSERK